MLLLISVNLKILCTGLKTWLVHHLTRCVRSFIIGERELLVEGDKLGVEEGDEEKDVEERVQPRVQKADNGIEEEDNRIEEDEKGVGEQRQ